MELKTFRQFRSAVQLAPAFASIHPKDRRRFLIDAYNLAKEKYEKENWMETAHEAAKSSRASSTGKLFRVAKHIRNALAEIEKAKKAIPTGSPKLLKYLQVQESSDLLRAAYDDLGFLVGMDIAAIHPHHRTNFEKQHLDIYSDGFLSSVEKRFSDMPGRQSRFDYLLVAALSSRLDKCATSTGRPLRPIDRRKIISCIFLAALGQYYVEGTVKTALLRTSGQQPV
jgi:hypothetical protein